MLNCIAALILCAVGIRAMLLLGKYLGQPISSALPRHQVKAGTPTMAGVSIWLSFLVISMLWGNNITHLLLGSMPCFLLGLLDDLIKVNTKSNKSLNKSTKFAILFALQYLAFIYLGYSIELNLFNTILVMGFAAAFDITDGLDGLAGLLSLTSLLPTAAIMPNLSATILTMCGSILGFLVYNLKPARIFMGDSGSLLLGGFIGNLFILSGYDIRVILFSIIPLLNLLSVGLRLAQIKTGIKLFKFKAPFHHHMEDYLGENGTVSLLVGISALMSTITLYCLFNTYCNFLRAI